MNIEQVKRKYGYPLKNHHQTLTLTMEDFHWLVEQADLTKRYEEALINTYVEGMSMEEILEAADNQKQKEDIYKKIERTIGQYHESDSPLPLREYLGLTDEQYTIWLSTGELPNEE